MPVEERTEEAKSTPRPQKGEELNITMAVHIPGIL